MIRADQIPDEVVEAAGRLLCIADGRDPDQLGYFPVASGERPKRVENWCAYIEMARASIAAALSAWPWKFTAESIKMPHIILPLPTEMNDE